ncbi:hypothetical protein Vi05172_g5988 [Venturia inaequalis]|nr:hypothetical protein Vi05172_g5988 [Venturia inaequalis]
MSKIFTVFGATGNQGGSVVKNVLENAELSKTYKIRAITRDVTKPAALALKAKGAEVVAADMNDKDSIIAAIQGSSFVFAVTNYWEKMSAEIEIEQGKVMADASKAAGVERFFWSSLPNVSKESHGKITSVHHFDSKAKVEEYIRFIGLPATFVMPGLFMSYIWGTALQKTAEGFTWSTPLDPDSTGIPLFDPASDMGLFVSASLLLQDETLNKRILAAAGYVTPNEVASIVKEITGKPAVVKKITFEEFHGYLSPAAADELVGNFQLVVDPGYYVGEPADALENSIALVEKAGLRKPVSLKHYIQKQIDKASIQPRIRQCIRHFFSSPTTLKAGENPPFLELSQRNVRSPYGLRKHHARLRLKEVDSNIIDQASSLEEQASDGEKQREALSDLADGLSSGSKVKIERQEYDSLTKYEKGNFKIDQMDIAKRERPSPSVHLIRALQLIGKGHLMEPTCADGRFDQKASSKSTWESEHTRDTLGLDQEIQRDTSISLQSITAKFIRRQIEESRPGSVGEEEEEGFGVSGVSGVLEGLKLVSKEGIDRLIPPLSGEENDHIMQEGFTTHDVLLWSTILTEKDSFLAAYSLATEAASLACVEIQGTARVPLFVLNFSLRRRFIAADALQVLLQYAMEYIEYRNSMHSEQAEELQHRRLGPLDLSSIFLLFIRLLRHARKVWPAAIVPITSIIIDHYLPSYTKIKVNPSERQFCTEQCNVALHLISLQTSLNPMDSAAYQQRAQFDLLRAMAGLLLPATRLGHNAVTSVLLRLEKTPQERDWARLKAASWPPFRRSRTRLDDAKGAEYGKSRAGRALDYMQQYGYPLKNIDRAMKIMSGFHVDGSPTIQTREIISGKAHGSAQMWAAMVTSTRTLPEAWACFLRCREFVTRTHHLVYHAMLKKIIYDRIRLDSLQEVRSRDSHFQSSNWFNDTESALPGDGRQTLPAPEDPTDAIYIPSEPPSLESLFDQMISDGVVPETPQLQFLMAHSPTFPFGLKVWAANTSGTPPLMKDGLHPEIPFSEHPGPHEPPLRTDLPPLSASAIASLVGLLCKFPDADTSSLLRITNVKSFPISTLPGTLKYWAFHTGHPFIHAYLLLKTYKTPSRRAWLHLLTALESAKTMENLSMDFSWKTDASHPLIALVLSQHIVASLKESGLEIDHDMFKRLCRIAQHAAPAHYALKWEPGDQTNRLRISRKFRNGLRLASVANYQSKACPQFLRSLFTNLVNGRDVTFRHRRQQLKPRLRGSISASLPAHLAVPDLATLHAYVRALGLFSDFEGVYSLVRWMVSAKEDISKVTARKLNGMNRLKRCIVAVRALLESPGRDVGMKMVEDKAIEGASEELIALVKEQIESVPEWGGWPSDEMVEQYFGTIEDGRE